ncbi:MAG: nucleoside diphosphate kinase regulator [Verrucomicrobia bacterium]|nr:nucleoside diphosphate kinase regulator [Verrucomicrobiota bacterium]
MTNNSPIFLTREDYTKLRLLVASASRPLNKPAPHGLERELDRAVVVDPAAIPPDVVTLDSRVEYEDIETGEVAEYVITLPERANVDQRRISVLAPIGTALIGFRVGDVVRWATPGGARELTIRRVTREAAETLYADRAS